MYLCGGSSQLEQQILQVNIRVLFHSNIIHVFRQLRYWKVLVMHKLWWIIIQVDLENILLWNLLMAKVNKILRKGIFVTRFLFSFSFWCSDKWLFVRKISCSNTKSRRKKFSYILLFIWLSPIWNETNFVPSYEIWLQV